MISRIHKCIFIHISKCAGTTIEKAFLIPKKHIPPNYEQLYGWSEKHKLNLQHATPQQLLDTNLITKEEWSTFYKFIIVRNPWSRSYSDYMWVMQNSGVFGQFSDFIQAKGPFESLLNKKDVNYLGDHLLPQKEYFFLNGNAIKYDAVVPLETISQGLEKVSQDLNLPHNFFKQKENVTGKKLQHYSLFYTPKRKALVAEVYKEDINFLKYTFEDQSHFSLSFMEDFRLMFSKHGKLNLRLKYPYLAYQWGIFKRRFIP